MGEVVFESVSKVFPGGTVALDDLSLEIPEGQFMILVGPSGCGKTTALRCVAGLEKPTRGTIRVGDRVVNDVTPRDRDIAMVFQNYALYPHMSVYKNLAFGLKQRKTPKDEIDRRVRDVSTMLGLDELLKRRPAQLSGGQRQRVAMGRALVREPSAFLLDEPLSNLDAKLRVQMRAELKRLHNRLGITTIYVTHDQIEAMTLGDRIAVMSAGKLQQLGPPQELYDAPAPKAAPSPPASWRSHASASPTATSRSGCAPRRSWRRVTASPRSSSSSTWWSPSATRWSSTAPRPGTRS
jgi:ABC-type sugar transport system ATPase subunit